MSGGEDDLAALWEAMARLQGPFIEWLPRRGSPEEDGAILPRGHPGVIVERGPRHLSVLWIGHEHELISVGAVYDTNSVSVIDVRTFCRRVLALPEDESD